MIILQQIQKQRRTSITYWLAYTCIHIELKLQKIVPTLDLNYNIKEEGMVYQSYLQIVIRVLEYLCLCDVYTEISY